jgi:hypothetical protein
MTTMLPGRQMVGENHEVGAAGIKLAGDHPALDPHRTYVPGIILGIDHQKHDPHGSIVDVTNFASGHATTGLQTTNVAGEPNPEMITHYGAILDLWEGFRKSIDNQVRAFTRIHGTGKDDPDILMAMAFRDSIKKYEATVTKVLEKSVALHPLAPWIKSTRGLGNKAVGRVLAAIEDPYWNGKLDEPRTAAQLRQYCGFGDPAQRRRKNERGNWNPRARMAVWNVADPIIKSRGLWRPVYDEARERYADAVHADHCAQCGPKLKPALPGSPLNKGHQHARGIRAVCKKFLNELHAESVRLHRLNSAA